MTARFVTLDVTQEGRLATLTLQRPPDTHLSFEMMEAIFRLPEVALALQDPHEGVQATLEGREARWIDA